MNVNLHYDDLQFICIHSHSKCGDGLSSDPEVASLIPAWFHTFVEIDHEIISTAILLPSADSRRVVANYERKCRHEVLLNRLVKLSQEKGWLGELTILT